MSSAASLLLLSRRDGGELVPEARRQRTLRWELGAHAAVWLCASNVVVLQLGQGGLRTPMPWLNSLVVALVAAVPLLIVWHRRHAPRDGLAVSLLRLLRLAVAGFFALPLVAVIAVFVGFALSDSRFWASGIVPLPLGVGVLIVRRANVRGLRRAAIGWFAVRLFALILLSLGWCSALLIDRECIDAVPYRGAEYVLLHGPTLRAWELRREHAIVPACVHWSSRVRCLTQLPRRLPGTRSIRSDAPQKLCVVGDVLFVEYQSGERIRAH